jgi:pimeloyl-ACP methyl ester carboxylesterase
MRRLKSAQPSADRQQLRDRITANQKECLVPFVETSSARLFYTDDGDGMPMLLVHGWTCDSNDWLHQIPKFSQDHRVITVDLRGHGRSASTRLGYAPSDFAEDLAELIQALALSPVVAVGHSLGGTVVSVLAARFPALVAAVVVVDPAYGFADEAAAGARRLAADMARSPSHDVVLARLGLDGPVQDMDTVTLWRRRRALSVPIDVLAACVEGVHAGDEPIAERPAMTRLIAERQAPVLATWARPQDGEWESSLLEAPSQVEMFDDCGHWLHQEAPERFNETVLRWLDGLELQSAPAESPTHTSD